MREMRWCSGRGPLRTWAGAPSLRQAEGSRHEAGRPKEVRHAVHKLGPRAGSPPPPPSVPNHPFTHPSPPREVAHTLSNNLDWGPWRQRRFRNNTKMWILQDLIHRIMRQCPSFFGAANTRRAPLLILTLLRPDSCILSVPLQPTRRHTPPHPSGMIADVLLCRKVEDLGHCAQQTIDALRWAVAQEEAFAAAGMERNARRRQREGGMYNAEVCNYGNPCGAVGKEWRKAEQSKGNPGDYLAFGKALLIGSWT